MEKKRYYRRPTSKLIPLDTTEILAGSDGNIPAGDPNGPDTPTSGDGGFIWVESKRQGDRIIDDDEDW